MWNNPRTSRVKWNELVEITEALKNENYSRAHQMLIAIHGLRVDVDEFIFKLETYLLQELLRRHEARKELIKLEKIESIH